MCSNAETILSSMPSLLSEFGALDGTRTHTLLLAPVYLERYKGNSPFSLHWQCSTFNSMLIPRNILTTGAETENRTLETDIPSQ